MAVTTLPVCLPLIVDCSLFTIFFAAYRSQAWRCNSLWLTHATLQPKAQELSLALPSLFSFWNIAVTIHTGGPPLAWVLEHRWCGANPEGHVVWTKNKPSPCFEEPLWFWGLHCCNIISSRLLHTASIPYYSVWINVLILEFEIKHEFF